MERGLYIAAAGMLAEQVRQDHISHDLANAATNGYKPDRVSQRSFADALLENSRQGAEIGRLGRGPVIGRSVTDFSQGELKDTGSPLDLAIAGEGFFGIRTAQGIRYTRDGSFQSNGAGQLVDQLGNPVLSRGGGPITVGEDGNVPREQVGVFRLTNPQKVGDDQFTGGAAGQATGEVQSGVLESSGVDPGKTMVNMMASMRAFEAGQKAITTIDETLRGTAQVGSLPN